MKLLSNKEIDYQKWDEQIARSRESSIYAQSWFLDIASPHWKAWVDDEYQILIPLPVVKRWGVPLLRQPIYCQQLGVFSLSPYEINLYTDLLKSIKKKYFQIIFSASTANLHDHPDIAQFKNVCKYPNHVLNLENSYESYYQGFNQNRRRDLKKAERNGLQIHESEDVEMLVEMYIEEKKPKELSVYHQLVALFKEAKKRKCAKLILAIHPKTGVHSGAIFWFYQQKITYAFGATNGLGKTTGANTFLFNSVIKQYSGSKNILDFEGSRVDSIASFYKSLGGKECYYPVVKYKMLG